MFNKNETLKENIIDEMTPFQLSRWLALVNGVELIAENAERFGKTWDTIYIKQPALEDYIDKECILIYRQLTGENIK